MTTHQIPVQRRTNVRFGEGLPLRRKMYHVWNSVRSKGRQRTLHGHFGAVLDGFIRMHNR